MGTALGVTGYAYVMSNKRQGNLLMNWLPETGSNRPMVNSQVDQYVFILNTQGCDANYCQKLLWPALIMRPTAGGWWDSGTLVFC